MGELISFAEYQEGLARGRLQGLLCKKCGAVVFPSRAVCPECGASEMERHEVKGEGVVRSFTVIRVAPMGFTPPYVVAMVELTEGPWVVGNLMADPDSAGMELMNKRVSVGSGPVPEGASSFEDLRVLTFRLLD